MKNWIRHFTYKIEARAANAGWLYRLARRYYTGVIEREAALANITAADHVLCIGGGMCPFSAILIHEITGARVTVIDNNHVCIPLAQQVVQRLGLEESIRVVCADGLNADIDFSLYTVVHLALQVSPMAAVFSQVEARVAAGTRLLVRRPKKALDALYCTLSRHALAHSPYTLHKSRNIGATLLYTKFAHT